MFTEHKTNQLMLLVHKLTLRVDKLEEELRELKAPKVKKTKQNSQRKIKQEGEFTKTENDDLRTPD